MTITLILTLILLVSFILALRSMKDFQPPDIIKKFVENKKIRGTIVFFTDGIKRYSSSSSSLDDADDINSE